ncbi:MAG TPA: AAA family ATPase [Syntrophomonadaceae bacterium]|nr:AAA family ATPase [Syntrophomonadaceae bacterium]
MKKPVKISKIVLKNFKCFAKEQPIDCEADVVILTGNNGYGKTSVIEAIELVATGSIEPRIGSGSGEEQAFQEYINHYTPGREAANVEIVAWDGEEYYARLQQSDAPSFKRFPDGGFLHHFLRNSCFYYQDGVENLLGRNQNGLSGVAEAFVGDIPGEKVLLNALVRASAEVDNLRKKFRVYVGDEEPLVSKAVEYAAKLERIFPLRDLKKEIVVEWPTQIVTKKGFAKQYESRLQRWVESLTGKQLSGMPVCEVLDEAAKYIEARRKEIFSEIFQPVIRSDENISNLKTLLKNLPERFSTDLDLVKLRKEKEALEKENKACYEKIALMRKRMEILVVERDLPVPDAGLRIWMGIIPLLASLHYLSRVDNRNIQDELGQEAFRHDETYYLTKLKEKWKEFRQLKEETAQLYQKMKVNQERLNELSKKEKLIENVLRVLELWKAVFNVQLEPICRGEGVYYYDFLKARSDLEKRFPDISSGDRAQLEAAWNEAVDALRNWQVVEQRREEVKSKWTPGLQQADKQLESFVSWANKRKIEEWFKKIKDKALTEQYIDQLNQALEIFLLQFGSAGDLAENVRFGRDQEGKITLMRWKEQGQSNYNFASILSTAQLNQVAIAYMLALNRGVRDHPFGFICLDDVSSAFDLNNLAADAHLIRMLAYGDDPAQSRQIFLTSHHDEITTRLLPLLLPPKGKTLKIVEFVDFDPKEGPAVKVYRVREAGASYEVMEKAFS